MCGTRSPKKKTNNMTYLVKSIVLAPRGMLLLAAKKMIGLLFCLLAQIAAAAHNEAPEKS